MSFCSSFRQELRLQERDALLQEDVILLLQN